MKRTEEITKAALEFSPCNPYIRDIFIAGALWADNHPKNFWHSVANGELPKSCGRYIVMAQNGYCHTCQYHTDDRYWGTVGYQSDIKYWMEIPELPTELNK